MTQTNESRTVNPIQQPQESEVRAFLRDVRSAYLRSQVLCERAQRYREMAMRATGRADAIRTSGTSRRSKVENYVLSLVDTHAELGQEIDRLMESSRKAEALIAGLKDDRYHAVLQFRYLCGMTWEDIAEKLHFTLRWVHKLHNEAMVALEQQNGPWQHR